MPAEILSVQSAVESLAAAAASIAASVASIAASASIIADAAATIAAAERNRADHVTGGRSNCPTALPAQTGVGSPPTNDPSKLLSNSLGPIQSSPASSGTGAATLVEPAVVPASIPVTKSVAPAAPMTSLPEDTIPATDTHAAHTGPTIAKPAVAVPNRTDVVLIPATPDGEGATAEGPNANKGKRAAEDTPTASPKRIQTTHLTKAMPSADVGAIAPTELAAPTGLAASPSAEQGKETALVSQATPATAASTKEVAVTPAADLTKKKKNEAKTAMPTPAAAAAKQKALAALNADFIARVKSTADDLYAHSLAAGVKTSSGSTFIVNPDPNQDPEKRRRRVKVDAARKNDMWTSATNMTGMGLAVTKGMYVNGDFPIDGVYAITTECAEACARCEASGRLCVKTDVKGGETRVISTVCGWCIRAGQSCLPNPVR